MTIFANERDSESVSPGTSEPDQDRQAEERRIPGDADFKCKSGSLELNRLEGGDVLVVSKLHPGFDDECVDDLTRLLSAISSGRTARPKYLVFDFAHRRGGEASGSAGFQNLVAANSELILDAPVITVAWVRSFMAGADFEFACHCAMLVAERGALFSFDGDPDRLFGLYASLARKIGLVRDSRAHGDWRRARSRGHAQSLARQGCCRAEGRARGHRRLHAAMWPPLQRRLRHFSRAEVGHEHDRPSRGRADPRLKRSRNAAFRRRSCF